jgi:hypothetical protein
LLLFLLLESLLPGLLALYPTINILFVVKRGRTSWKGEGILNRGEKLPVRAP